MRATAAVIVLLAVLFLTAYPVAAFIAHGLKPDFWPADLIRPEIWFSAIFRGDISVALPEYKAILFKQSESFANGGWSSAVVFAALPPIFLIMFYLDRPRGPIRFYQDIFGDARFANAGEKRQLSRGLELGIDPDTGRPVRVQVEGTLLSIGHPRTGKTSGMLIPNVAFPEASAYAGAAVVIDPKGEVYQAVAERRRTLGRKVVHIDPLGAATDRWNPIATFDPSDILSMQQTARLLLPVVDSNTGTDDYFRGRAAAIITAAILASYEDGDRTIIGANTLINNESKFISSLKRLLSRRDETVAEDVLAMLQSDDKETYERIKSAAQRAFEWCSDHRMRAVVTNPTFKMIDVAEGRADLFVTIPTDLKTILSSFTRWLLADLVTHIRSRDRQQRPRIVLFLDEAAALGRFEVIETAAAELPGYGLSLWSFWQDRAQLLETYGQHGAEMLIRSAEFVSISDISSADPKEAEQWSDAIGSYTAALKSFTESKERRGTTTSISAQKASLMTKEALIAMPTKRMIVLPHSNRATRHPIALLKTISYRDPRFRKYTQNVPPVGAIE